MKNQTAKNIVVVGSTNWDITMYLPSLPLPGETVVNGRRQNGLGGKGANQAVAAYRAGGVDTCFISCVGDDDIASAVHQVFADLQMPVPQLMTLPDTATGSACIFVNAEGENCIGVDSGANAMLTPARLETQAELINAAGIVLTQLEIPLATVELLAELCSQSGVTFVLNPAPARALPDSLLARVDLLTPNEVELGQLSGMPTATDAEKELAARQLCAKGVGTVVVTLGARGCLMVTRDSIARVPGLHVTAVDTTGAGDVFNGALVAELLRGSALADAAQTACRAAALAVMGKGAIAAIPTRDAVLAFKP